jgi:hypothetical protein
MKSHDLFFYHLAACNFLFLFMASLYLERQMLMAVQRNEGYGQLVLFLNLMHSK